MLVADHYSRRARGAAAALWVVLLMEVGVGTVFHQAMSILTLLQKKKRRLRTKHTHTRTKHQKNTYIGIFVSRVYPKARGLKDPPPPLFSVGCGRLPELGPHLRAHFIQSSKKSPGCRRRCGSVTSISSLVPETLRRCDLKNYLLSLPNSCQPCQKPILHLAWLTPSSFPSRHNLSPAHASAARLILYLFIY